MELYFLGTGAGMPSKHRNVTSVALNLTAEAGCVWLFDCGEGTQHQILRSPIKPGKIERLFVTHLHGDHLYGIPGFLTSRSYQGGESDLKIYGPKGIREFIETALRISEAHPTYGIDIVELEEGELFSAGGFTVETKRLDHRIECFGFRIRERSKPGRLDAERLKALGVPPGPIYRALKQGEDAVLPDGRTIRGRELLGPETPGRTVTLLGDTRICESGLELARGADVLVHEATFAGDLPELAEQYGHATSVQAAGLAKEAGVGTLILTHLSSRYQEESAERLLSEARDIFAHTYLAEDFWAYPIPRK